MKFGIVSAGIFAFLAIEGVSGGKKSRDQSRDHSSKSTGGVARVANREASYSCPDGYNLIDKRCTRESIMKMEESCEHGTLSNGQCISYLPVIKECPAGYSKVGKSCIRRVRQEKIGYCHDGYVMNGKSCERTVDQERDIECREGWSKHGDQCKGSRYVNAQFTCPEPYEYTKSKCVLRETYDCSPTPCEGKDCYHLRQLGSKKNKNNNKQTTGKNEVVHVVQKMCERVKTKPAVPFCAEGTAYGQRCAISVYEEPVQMCKKGGKHNKHNQSCSFTSSLPVMYKCPNEDKNYVNSSYSNSSYSNNGKNGKNRKNKKRNNNNKHQQEEECYTTESVDYIVACPDKCVMEGSKCVRYSSPKSVCFKGKHHKSGNCSFTEYVQPKVTVNVTYECDSKDCGGLNNKQDKHNKFTGSSSSKSSSVSYSKGKSTIESSKQSSNNYSKHSDYEDDDLEGDY